LSANIWGFSDKSQPTIERENQSSTFPYLDSSNPVTPDADLATESFQFSSIAPFPSKERKLQAQLTVTQQALDNKSRQLKRAQQKAYRQLKASRNKNGVLQRELSLLGKQLVAQQAVISHYRQQITNLQNEPLPLLARQTEMERFKESIDEQPDLIRSRLTKKEIVQSSISGITTTTEKAAPKQFSGSMEFGFSYEQDNIITKSVSGRLILDYAESGKYNINSDLDFEFESEDRQRSAEKYRWQLQSDYNLDPINLLYARSDISRSQFSSYEKEDIFTLGYGRIFFNNPKHKFNIEVGPGYRFAAPNLGEEAVSIDEFIVRTRLNYERVLSDSLRVKMDSVLEAGHSNNVYSMGFQAQNRIYQQLYLTFDLDYKFTENVPVDTVQEEISSGLNLLYAF